MKTRSFFYGLGFAVCGLLSCDREAANLTTSSSIALAPRVSRAASVTDSLWAATSYVHAAVTTTNGIQLANDTVPFYKETLPTISAPSDQGVTLSIEGWNNALSAIWSGTVTLPPSTRDTSFAITVSAVSASSSGNGTTAGTVNAPTLDSTSIVAWAANTFDQPVHVYLSCKTPNSTIHYTLDGSYPTALSPTYGDTGVLVDSNRTINAIAVRSGWTNSAELISPAYVLRAQPVAIIADGNVGYPPFKIGLSCSTPGTVIHYTTDGTKASASSAVYTDSLIFSGYDSLTYQAIAIDTLHPNVAQSAGSSQRFGPTVLWNSSVTYGSLTDPRDNQTYRTVKIGTQTWMAQNLNYKTDSSWCYDDSDNECHKYGRLYQWSAAMGLSSAYNTTLWQGADSAQHQGACPSGWHVPRDAEWSVLVQSVDSATSGTKLKSAGGWVNLGNGTDTYGFRILPAGRRLSYGVSEYLGGCAFFWSSSEGGASVAWDRYACEGNAGTLCYGNDKLYGHSLRCIQN